MSAMRWNHQMQEAERLCDKCGEWLPATEEFFVCRRGSLQGPCIACREEKRLITNLTTACCVEGCDKPRHVGKRGCQRYSRCTEHQAELYHARKKAVG